MKVAVLGSGRMVAIHAETVAGHPETTVATIASRTLTSARQLATRHGARATSDLHDVWSDPTIAAVVITAPTEMHCDLIEDALDAGKAVLCEKPLGTNLARVAECLRRTGERQSRVLVGMNRRFDRNFEAVRDSVISGHIGRVESIHIVTRVAAPPSHRYLERSGGLFHDMSIHDFDLARLLHEEEPVRVYATGSALIDPTISNLDDIDSATIVLEYESGARATIENARRSAYGVDCRVEVFGSEGLVTARNGGSAEVRWSTRSGTDTRRPHAEQIIDVYRESYVRQWAHFVEVENGVTPPRATLADGLSACRIATAAEHSLRSRQTVELPRSTPSRR